MNRPYVFCHMMCALDGKIMGGYMGTPQGRAAGDAFYDIAFGKEPFYHHQGWLSGRVTTDDNFTFYRKPDLDEDAPAVPAGDFIAQPDFGMFYVSVDPHGKLGWKSSTLRYVDTTAHVVEVLTEQVGNAYRAFFEKAGNLVHHRGRNGAGSRFGPFQAERRIQHRDPDASRWRRAELVVPASGDVR